jgi:hypothetical protein
VILLEVWDSVAIDIEEIEEGPEGSVMMQVAGAFRGESSGVPTWSRDAGLAAAGL